MLTHVVCQCAATTGALCHDDIDAKPGQQADGGCVDFWRKHLLGTAGKQRHAGAAIALRSMDLTCRHRAL